MDPSRLTVDAAALPGGLPVDAALNSRHFVVGENESLELGGLTLTRGDASNGGSIHSLGKLVLNRCVLTRNRSLGSPPPDRPRLSP